jgi:hypothetical protein
MAGLPCLLQLHKCPDLSDFQQKISSVLSYNEKLQKEKEALSEELNSCVDKVVKIIRNDLHRRVHAIMSISLWTGPWPPVLA